LLAARARLVQVYHRVIDTRQILDNMMAGCDDRLLVVIGPSAVAGGAEKLRAIGETMAKLSSKMSRDLVLVLQADAAMGHAPNPDGTYQINRGIRQSRELLLQINKLGLPTAVEFRDTITPQFFADLLSWASVSAQSETLQELVSGLSMPVGLRAPAEDVGSLLRALETSKGHHHFLGVSSEGIVGIVESTGNAVCVLVLGGGRARGGGVVPEHAAVGKPRGRRPRIPLARIRRSRQRRPGGRALRVAH